MADRCFCPRCFREFDQPRRRYLGEYGPVTVDYFCPYCDGPAEAMDLCPACGVGWKRAGAHVCPKCHLRAVSELRLFTHRFGPEMLAEMDDMLDGVPLSDFQ